MEYSDRKTQGYVPDDGTGGMHETEPESAAKATLAPEYSFPDVYRETVRSADELTDRFSFYRSLLQSFREGKATAELHKRYMLKAIDEVWVRAVEDTIPSLDTIIRNPGALLKEEEEVMPIEQTRRVTSRSIQHLSQHTDYINEIRDNGMVIPSKLLNVYQDETVVTYENKFINTLLSRLYGFVALRYEKAQSCGEDEKTTKFDLSQEFTRGEQNAKIHLTIELSEPPEENEVVKNYIYTTDLWKRVERINHIVLQYMDSDFVRRLQKAYIRPPVMRTNKLLKNVDFRQCLALWEFLEQYENTGYETLIEENLESVSENFIREIYDTVSMQYVIFKRHIRNAFEEENELFHRDPGPVVQPKFAEELDPLNEREFDERDLVPAKAPENVPEVTGEEDEIERAVCIALAADAYFTAEEEEAEQAVVLRRGEIAYRYKYSFLARLIFAQDPTQDLYTAIKNELLSYEGVKSRISWNHEAFSAGRKKCARVNVKGKTLFLYLPLDPADYAGTKYRGTDLSADGKARDLSFLFKVRSERGAKYAKELIADVMAKFGIEKMPQPEKQDYHLPAATPEQLAKADPPLVRILGDLPEPEPEIPATPVVPIAVKPDIEYRYRFSFRARLIQAQEPLFGYYGQVKNHLLSYAGVKANMAWGYESFRLGRAACARLKGRGKTLVFLLALDPAPFAGTKYHVKDLAGKGGRYALSFRIRSDRGVKYAKDLIDRMMASLGGVQGEIPRVDYREPEMTVEEMLALPEPLVRPIGDGERANAEKKNAGDGVNGETQA